MKKIILLICIVTLSLSYLSAQEEYYWSGGKKNYVEKMKDRYIVKLDKDKDVKTLEKSLVDKKQIKSLAKIKKQIGIVVAPEGFEKGKHFTNVVPAYRIGNLSFYPTGEILLQPKKSIGISQILDLINNQATIVEQTKYNTFVLEAKDWGKLFNISNHIYESGMVEYCPRYRTIASCGLMFRIGELDSPS